MEYIGIILLVIVAALLYAEPFGGLIKCIMRKIGLYGDEKYQENDEQFIGSYAEVSKPFQKVGTYFQGYVKLNGVEWKALCRIGQLSSGTPVIIKNISNLTLEVEPK
ncbi:MAG: NfeD family protein [Candidatus Electrothrix sp. Rat3]|nr:NfeD family protein [Candidatus Electrothrix rattekaaiensis]